MKRPLIGKNDNRRCNQKPTSCSRWDWILCQNTSVANIITHCDVNYLSRVVALVESIQNLQNGHNFIVVAHDVETLTILGKQEWQQVEVVRLMDILSLFPDLASTKSDKSAHEFIFAITPFLLKYANEKFYGESVWYVDADIYFFAPFKILEGQTTGFSIMVTAHNFPKRLQHLEIYGKYNVGIIFVSGDSQSKNTIEWWARKCLEDSSIFSSPEIYGDQKYLDQFPSLNHKFGSFGAIEDSAAPWNVEDADLDGIVSYHFSGFRQHAKWIQLGLAPYIGRVPRRIKNEIYKPYYRHLNLVESDLFGSSVADNRPLDLKTKLKILILGDYLFRGPKFIQRAND